MQVILQGFISLNAYCYCCRCFVTASENRAYSEMPDSVCCRTCSGAWNGENLFRTQPRDGMYVHLLSGMILSR